MDRRQFHQSAAATAAALATGLPSPAFAGLGPAMPDPVPAGAAARFGCNRLWHQWPASNPGLNDLTFSPDGRYLATLGYQDDHAFIWSVPDGRPVRDWSPQEVDRGGDLRWTDRGLYIASNGGLSLWEPLSATLIHRYTDPAKFQAVRGLALSADGRLVATTAFIDCAAEVWDTATHRTVAKCFAEIDGKRRRPHDGQGDFLMSVAFSRCGRWLAAGGYRATGGIGGQVHVWDLAARRHLQRFPTRTGPVVRMAFTPAGRLLTADWAGTLELYDPLDGRMVQDWPGGGNSYRGLATNASGRIVVQRDDGVRLWDPDPTRETLLCPARGVNYLAYSDDGRFVAVGGHAGRVELYDAATGADLSPADRHATHVDRIEFTAAGTFCLACLGYPVKGHINEVVLRDTRTGTRLPVTPPADWRALALAPVGTRVAGRLTEDRLAVWDWASGAVAVQSEINPRAVAWHPNGETLVAAGADGTVTSWHVGTGRTGRQPVAGPIIALAVAARRTVAMTESGEMFVWQLDADERPQRLVVPGPVPKWESMLPKWRLALSPDGSSVAVTFGDGTVYAGSVDAGELAAVYTHPAGDEGVEDGNTLVLRYTPAGRLRVAGLCTALVENRWWCTATVIDAESGDVVWRAPPQRMGAAALALTPDGGTLFTGHEDGTLLVWPLASL